MTEIRPVVDEAGHTLALAVLAAVEPEEAIGIAERLWLVETVPRQRHFLALEDGGAVGTASAAFFTSRPLPHCRVLVRPEVRRGGIGAALFAAISEWARAGGATEGEGEVDEREPAGLSFAQRRGFVEIGREILAVLELDGEPPVAEPPPGVEIVTWAQRPELAPGMYRVYEEGHVDIPGSEDEATEPYDEWLQLHMRGAGDKPEATFVAVADGEVVGYAKLSLTSAQPTVAFHDLTAVKRAWRGRGVARALKASQIGWAKANGYERLKTGNEERNAPIRRLNERFGYRPGPAQILMRGPLA
jgi:GNAT superfamily N-acetyltransferase